MLFYWWLVNLAGREEKWIHGPEICVCLKGTFNHLLKLINVIFRKCFQKGENWLFLQLARPAMLWVNWWNSQTVWVVCVSAWSPTSTTYSVIYVWYHVAVSLHQMTAFVRNRGSLGDFASIAWLCSFQSGQVLWGVSSYLYLSVVWCMITFLVSFNDYKGNTDFLSKME